MTAAQFKAAFPDPLFAAVTDDQINALTALAAPYFDVNRWGSYYFDGLGNWIAHRLATQAGGQLGADSTTTSQSVGAVSFSVDASLAAKDPYMATRYGQQYAQLRRKVGMGGLIV